MNQRTKAAPSRSTGTTHGTGRGALRRGYPLGGVFGPYGESRMSALRRTSRGFTLVEVILALALMALLMVAAALAMEAAHDSHAYNAEKTDLVLRTRGVLDRIARDIRVAKSFHVPDPRTLDVTMPDDTVHTYAWDGASGGNLIYTVTDGLAVSEDVLTGQVHAFSVSDRSPACSVSLALEGDLAKSEASLTATPRKSVF